MAQETRNKLATWFPQAQHPIIISAPMLGTSNGTLAAEVSKAGGIGKFFALFRPSRFGLYSSKTNNKKGIIPGGFNFSPDSPRTS